MTSTSLEKTSDMSPAMVATKGTSAFKQNIFCILDRYNSIRSTWKTQEYQYLEISLKGLREILPTCGGSKANWEIDEMLEELWKSNPKKVSW